MTQTQLIIYMTTEANHTKLTTKFSSNCQAQGPTLGPTQSQVKVKVKVKVTGAANAQIQNLC